MDYANDKTVENSRTYNTNTYISDDERVYAYLRVNVNNKTLYAFIVWIGPDVGVLQKAAVSKDESFVKNIWEVSWSFSYGSLKIHVRLMLTFLLWKTISTCMFNVDLSLMV